MRTRTKRWKMNDSLENGRNQFFLSIKKKPNQMGRSRMGIEKNEKSRSLNSSNSQNL